MFDVTVRDISISMLLEVNLEAETRLGGNAAPVPGETRYRIANRFARVLRIDGPPVELRSGRVWRSAAAGLIILVRKAAINKQKV